jgi:hypothetical protein
VGERIEAHVLEGAEARAKLVTEQLQAAYAEKGGVALSPAQVISFFQLATDLRRLVAEVRRLLAVHERAKDLLDAAMDRAYHTQARLLRLGTGPHVPTVTDAEAEARWSALVAMLRDNGLPYQGTSVFAEHDQRIQALTKKLDAALIQAEVARIGRGAAEAESQRLREERDEARREEVDAKQALSLADDEVTRLRRKVNRLVRRLRSEREAREAGLLQQLAQVIAREVRRGGA